MIHPCIQVYLIRIEQKVHVKKLGNNNGLTEVKSEIVVDHGHEFEKVPIRSTYPRVGSLYHNRTLILRAKVFIDISHYMT